MIRTSTLLIILPAVTALSDSCGAQQPPIFGPTDFASCTASVGLVTTSGGSTSCMAVYDADFSGANNTFIEFNALPASFDFTFSAAHDLTGFYLWNDRGLVDTGIGDFTLDFFDSSGVPTGSQFVSIATTINPRNNPVPEIFTFAAKPSTERVRLTVNTTLNTGGSLTTQVREIGFVPEPSSLGLTFPLLALFGYWRRSFC